MVSWNNLDTLKAFQELQKTKDDVVLKEVLAGEAGGERVRKYRMPMAAGLTYSYGAKKVNDDILEKLAALAKEAQLAEKYALLYNGEIINTGEKRHVLHQLTRGQLGDDVIADGVNKREFYVAQQQKIADFANKVHNGEIVNEAGEKFNTVVQIGIGGSDLGPRAIYLALENWARTNNTLKMEAKFVSNVDPDDIVGVLRGVDLAHALFIVVSLCQIPSCIRDTFLAPVEPYRTQSDILAFLIPMTIPCILIDTSSHPEQYGTSLMVIGQSLFCKFIVASPIQARQHDWQPLLASRSAIVFLLHVYLLFSTIYAKITTNI